MLLISFVTTTLFIIFMYRESYPDQQNSMQNNPSMSMGYDYRSPPPPMSGYKPSSSIDHQYPPPSMYYEPPMVPYSESYPGMMPPPMQPMQQAEPMFDQRYYWREMEPKVPQSYPPSSYPPQKPSLVQRVSSLIQSQLPYLQSIMMQVSSSNISRQRRERNERSRSRSHSRSRSRQKRRKNSEGHDWLCRKCSFSNFDWRDNCKKCKESRHSRSSFVPSPEDWKCDKCGNINYARRKECNRCKNPKKS